MLSRIKLIDDAFTLGVNGLIGFDIPLWTIEYLATEHDEHVLPTALRHLRDIKAAVTDNSTLVSILQVLTLLSTLKNVILNLLKGLH